MKKILLNLLVCLAAVPCFAAKSKAPTTVPMLAAAPVKTQTGVASWYGSGFIGRKTANGEIYRSGDKTAAHKSLPFNSWVRVTDQHSGRSTVVRINNRGPYVRGRIIDLSRAAAMELGLNKRGITKVKLEVLRAVPADASLWADVGVGAMQPSFGTWFQRFVTAGLPLTRPM